MGGFPLTERMGGISMQELRGLVLSCIHDFSGNDDRIIDELNKIIEETGNEASHIIFKVLTHLNLDHDEAHETWKQLLSHRNKMISSLGRNVSLSTALCDYFCTTEKFINNPVILEIHVFEEHLKSLKYDSLTGLHTRGSFEEALEREMARAKRHKTDLSVVFFDIDDFKEINDNYGHLFGDDVLRLAAQTIRDATRTEDIAARYGGEEIVLILPETGKAKALVLAERIRHRLENMELEHEGRQVKLTISGGLATFPQDADETTNLLQEADIALYRAKSAGKNNIVLYSENQRRYLRIDFSSKINIQKIGFKDTKQIFEANSKDLSLAGILIESDHLVELGTKVGLDIPIEAVDTTLNVIGTIVRVEALGPDKFDLGISFIEMDKLTRSEISQYISHELEKMNQNNVVPIYDEPIIENTV